jgi:hypothetical protein
LHWKVPRNVWDVPGLRWYKMNLIDLLRAAGDRLGIVEMRPATSPRRPAKIQTRTVSLKDLLIEIRQEEVRALAELPAELSVPVEQIFATGVKAAAHGWTVERLKQLLKTEQFKSKDREEVQKAILNILANEKVAVEEVVRDAVARDQALDAFEEFAARKMEQRISARARKMSELESQVRSLQEELDGLRREAAQDEEHWRQWREKKAVIERELARAIGYLIDRPVITTADEP